MLATFREAQKKRTVGAFTGCYCEGCVACMGEVLNMLIEKEYVKFPTLE